MDFASILSDTEKVYEADLVIEAKAILKDQEMIYGQINYWEGPMKVMMKHNDSKIHGLGFTELVGYPSDYNYFKLETEELEKSIFKRMKNFLSF